MLLTEDPGPKHEAALQVERSPALRTQLADGNEAARRGLAACLLGVPEEDVADRAARSIGSVQVALISGLMTQWAVDPERAPTAPEVVRGLRAITEKLAGPPTPESTRARAAKRLENA